MNTSAKPISFRLLFALLLAFIVGMLLRFLWPGNMEWKNDEQINYRYSQIDPSREPLPMIGVASGVKLVNAAPSAWIYTALGHLPGVHDPVSLSMAVRAVSLIGCLILLFFALRIVDPSERELWLWAVAFQLVNPIEIYYDRKLWTQGLLLPFLALMLIGYWRKDRAWGAILWGFMGALLGQLHMSGFFVALSLLLSYLIFSKRNDNAKRPVWTAWLIGSAIASLPLIPWLIYIAAHPDKDSHSSNYWAGVLQLRFLVFYLTEPFGFHVGNMVGLRLGPSVVSQLSDIAKYPLLWNRSTWLVGAAHVVLLILMIAFTGILLLSALGRKRFSGRFLAYNSPETREGIWATGAIYGTMITLTGVLVRRYYLTLCKPFETVFFSRLAYSYFKKPRYILGLMWVLQALISYEYIHYTQIHHGAPDGDFLDSYDWQKAQEQQKGVNQ